MRDIKEPATYEDLIKKIDNHGFIIENKNECKQILSTVGYYRLLAYFLPFKLSDKTYKKGISFKRVYNIYEFDRKLRSLIFSAIEVTEINLRSSLSYFHSFKYGSLGYLDENNFNNKHNAEKFNENIEREIENNKKVLFVQHHNKEYGGKFPLWVMCELFTFGMLSYFYNDLKTPDKKQFAGVHYKEVESWLRCCTDLRNVCAHYGRLYYRIFSATPAGFSIPEASKRRLWGALLALKELYPSSTKWNNEFLPAIETLFEEYKADIDLYHLAFPNDWLKRLKKIDEIDFGNYIKSE